ncbi:winged helix DNA-binding protein [Staphylococcus edaphicus]|uniref:Winged helix DNA-binding protein n=1 Tax=Staphylococcus edaphicus TaxID=1955013 RepID=A0ABY4QF98_9STAP|nr:winged helix DNA-binding protein [Staphylococcus edaphicus]UQW82729.1 winged helix DNA-binding protein [Staphylococcus edaphicus]
MLLPNYKNLEETDLMNLISDRHNDLRQKVEYLTAQQLPQVQFGSSEWYLITIIKYDSPSLAELTQKINLTRQAIHKAVKQLEQKQVVQIEHVPNNKKEKRVTLTQLGITCYEKYIENKQQIIAHIAHVIGQSEVEQLHQLLQADWQLEHFKGDE